MDDILALLREGDTLSWIIVIFLLIRDLGPKIFPDIAKLWGSRISVENRLFEMLEDNNKSNIILAEAIVSFKGTLEKLDVRMMRMESLLSDRRVVDVYQWLQTLPRAPSDQKEALEDPSKPL